MTREREKLRKEMERKQREAITAFFKSAPSVKFDTKFQQAWDVFQDTAPEMLREAEPMDVLVAFEDFVYDAEKVYDQECQAVRDHHRRVARKAREAFLQLLDELQAAGKLTADSFWRELYPGSINKIK